MLLHLQFCGRQGEILIQDTVQAPFGRATEAELRTFALKHIDSLDLSQRCAKAIEQVRVFTVAASFKYE
jgi:hypothetical protein